MNETTNITKSNSAAFTGHRRIAYADRKAIKARVRIAVAELYRQGIRNFYCGMAMGFDLLAAEVVLSMQSRYTDIQLIAVIPFKGQESRFTPFEKSIYAQVLEQADKEITLSDHYYEGCLLHRNDFMLNHSSHLLAYYNGSLKGGTFYTINQASRRGLKVTNLF